MAKKDDGSDIPETQTVDATESKTVKLTAFYSGKESSLSPGTEIELDVAEADRLIELGAAVAVTPVASE